MDETRASSRRSEVLSELRTWLATGRPGTDPATIGDDTDLIDARVLDSLQLVEFILVIEDLAGRSILSETLDPTHIRSLSAVYANFFEDTRG
ncbi:MAG: acyl carrier protein [Polyangiaceae bacterium]|nr:acyl carrier protein [Polyangiaceae bacterium]